MGWRADRPTGTPPVAARRCRADRYRSQAPVRAQGAMLFDYPTADFHTTLLEHIATYRGTGAARYLRELRRALPTCGGTDDVGRWTVVRAGVAGRDSLLIRLRERWEYPDGQPFTHTTYVIVARTDRTPTSAGSTPPGTGPRSSR